MRFTIGSVFTQPSATGHRSSLKLRWRNFNFLNLMFHFRGSLHIVGGVETWQVYGIGGELVAEYPANALPASPQKEYGYRNGQLLVTATITSGWGAVPVLHDNPLNPNYPGETTVQARHITELRTAIDALRTHMGISAYSWQYSATTNDLITANPILEMRTALDQALGAPSGGYSAGARVFN